MLSFMIHSRSCFASLQSTLGLATRFNVVMNYIASCFHSFTSLQQTMKNSKYFALYWFYLLNAISRAYLALIRGLGGICPCPVCLVEKKTLSKLSNQSELRTIHGTQNLISSAKALSTKAAQNALLKKFGLRPLTVCTLLPYSFIC